MLGILNYPYLVTGPRQLRKQSSKNSLLPNVKHRHFSPPAKPVNSKAYLEVGFPFNLDKLFRKHAEEDQKPQKLR